MNTKDFCDPFGITEDHSMKEVKDTYTSTEVANLVSRISQYIAGDFSEGKFHDALMSHINYKDPLFEHVFDTICTAKDSLYLENHFKREEVSGQVLDIFNALNMYFSQKESVFNDERERAVKDLASTLFNSNLDEDVLKYICAKLGLDYTYWFFNTTVLY